MWVPRSRVLEAAQIGFPASVEAVRRFGGKAKHIKAVAPKTTDSRTFVEVIGENKMDSRGGGRGPFRGGHEDDRKDPGRENRFRSR